MDENEFYLFKNDGLERILYKIGLGYDKPKIKIYRILLLYLFTWTCTAILALLQGVFFKSNLKESFGIDLAAYGQFWLGIPLLLYAEFLLDNKVSRIYQYILNESNILNSKDKSVFIKRIASLQKFSNRTFIEIVIFAISFCFSFFWIIGEFNNNASTWHAVLINGSEIPTFAGYWDGFIAVPIFQYILYRCLWKSLVWFYFLWVLSRLQLNIYTAHPDQSGGLGFIGNAQASFGGLILAIGVVIAAMVTYKIWIEENSFTLFTVWAPILAFIIFTPIVFLCPLLFFMRHLYKAKENALLQYGKLASQYAASVFNSSNKNDLKSLDFDNLASLNSLYESTLKMRIVPFNLRNVKQLFVTSLGPMLPLLINLIPFGDKIKSVLIKLI